MKSIQAQPQPRNSEEKAAFARLRALRLIEEAQHLLYAAAQEACPLQGWDQPWTWIGEHADATKALWHRVNGAPRPTAHDNYESFAATKD